MKRDRLRQIVVLWPLAALSAVPLAANHHELDAAVDVVRITVADMDGSVESYSYILSFENASDVEVSGIEYERLEGVFGLRMRVFRRGLGGEFIEVAQYVAPNTEKLSGDHTAIVGDTEARLRFCWDLLGLTIAGTNEDYSIGQERHNNVFSARVRITSPRTANGPGTSFVPAGIVFLAGSKLRSQRGCLVRDPDVHVLQLSEVTPR